MRSINVEEITKNIKEMCIEANHFLTDDMKNVYSAMCGSLGVTGVTSESQEDGNSESGSASSDESGSGSSEDGTF